METKITKEKKAKVAKIYSCLRELINEPYSKISLSYIKKMEEAIKLFVDVYVKPDFEGARQCKSIYFDEKKQDVEKSINYGSQVNNNVFVNVGLLKSIEELLSRNNITPSNKNYEKIFVSTRNDLVLDLLLTAPHEIRHVMQYRYYRLAKEPMPNKRKLEFYKKLIGSDADKIVRDFDTNIPEFIKETKMYLEFLSSNNVDYKEFFQLYSSKNIDRWIYNITAPERNARGYEIVTLYQFYQDVRFLTREAKRGQRENPILKKSDKIFLMGKTEGLDRFLCNEAKCRALEENLIGNNDVVVMRRLLKMGKLATIEEIVEFAKKMKNDTKSRLYFIFALKTFASGQFLSHLFRDGEKMAKLKKMLEQEGFDYAAKGIERWVARKPQECLEQEPQTSEGQQ